jgi:hypothetical protein
MMINKAIRIRLGRAAESLAGAFVLNFHHVGADGLDLPQHILAYRNPIVTTRINEAVPNNHAQSGERKAGFVLAEGINRDRAALIALGQPGRLVATGF